MQEKSFFRVKEGQKSYSQGSTMVKPCKACCRQIDSKDNPIVDKSKPPGRIRAACYVLFALLQYLTQQHEGKQNQTYYE